MAFIIEGGGERKEIWTHCLDALGNIKFYIKQKGKKKVVAEYEYHVTMSCRKSNIICKQNHGKYSTNKATKKDTQKKKKKKGM